MTSFLCTGLPWVRRPKLATPGKTTRGAGEVRRPLPLHRPTLGKDTQNGHPGQDDPVCRRGKRPLRIAPATLGKETQSGHPG